MAEVTLRESGLVWQIEQLALQTSQSAEEVLKTAVATYLDDLERAGIQAETRAFWAMHDELVVRYSGEHVAFYQGEVVDHDTDPSALERRIRARFGPLPVLVAPVKPETRRDLRWRGGSIEIYNAAQ